MLLIHFKTESMQPLISIQILNWNRAEETQRAIESAMAQSYPNIEIIVVDNGSTDNSVSLTKQNFPHIHVIELDANYGCPGGRNKGIEYCNGEFIFYLDNDGVLHKDAVQKAYDIMKQEDKVVVVTGKVYDFDNPEEIDTTIVPRSEERYESTLFQGGICMHRKSMYETVGYYPSHFMYGGEESYLSCKILNEGLKIIRDESIILWHKRSDLARDTEGEILSKFYNTLYLSINLYPLQYALPFMLYFPIRYSKHAKREKIYRAYKKTFRKRYFSTVSLGFKNRTEPIKAATYRLFVNGYR